MRCSNHPSYKATDAKIWSSMGSNINEPVRNECEDYAAQWLEHDSTYRDMFTCQPCFCNFCIVINRVLDSVNSSPFHHLELHLQTFLLEQQMRVLWGHILKALKIECLLLSFTCLTVHEQMTGSPSSTGVLDVSESELHMVSCACLISLPEVAEHLFLSCLGKVDRDTTLSQ